ncbi:cyclic-phosphate processing receiver domain-containing protein [Telmatocola sphagniphila]|nr:cyclic-phosphate processing receiver domain-containing protein [Telmatocola sphagniphila]
MLEDNADRIIRFSTVLKGLNPQLHLHVWRDAWSMIREVESLLPLAILISLDHDLEPLRDSLEDPGTGWDVTKYLATLPPICPILVHTSNLERSSWMMGEFELAGWKHYRVPAIGDDWIEQDWRRIVRRVLQKNAPK